MRGCIARVLYLTVIVLASPKPKNKGQSLERIFFFKLKLFYVASRRSRQTLSNKKMLNIAKKKLYPDDDKRSAFVSSKYVTAPYK